MNFRKESKFSDSNLWRTIFYCLFLFYHPSVHFFILPFLLFTQVTGFSEIYCNIKIKMCDSTVKYNYIDSWFSTCFHISGSMCIIFSNCIIFYLFHIIFSKNCLKVHFLFFFFLECLLWNSHLYTILPYGTFYAVFLLNKNRYMKQIYKFSPSQKKNVKSILER